MFTQCTSTCSIVKGMSLVLFVLSMVYSYFLSFEELFICPGERKRNKDKEYFIRQTKHSRGSKGYSQMLFFRCILFHLFSEINTRPMYMAYISQSLQEWVSHAHITSCFIVSWNILNVIPAVHFFCCDHKMSDASHDHYNHYCFKLV